MILERQIKLNNNIYYIGIEVYYNNKKQLCKKNGKYFDCGDLSCLIKDIESNFKMNLDYEKEIYYMNDIIYLYDRFPFLSYIKNITFGNDKTIIEKGIITKEEIEDYINKNKIKTGLFNGKESICPLLFE